MDTNTNVDRSGAAKRPGQQKRLDSAAPWRSRSGYTRWSHSWRSANGNAVLVVTSRIAFAMARDGLLPRVLAAVPPRRGVPAAAANALLLGLVAVAGSIPLAIAVGGFLYVGHFVPPLLALGILRHRERNRNDDRELDGWNPAFRTPAAAVLLPLAACVVLVVASGLEGALGALGWLTVGLSLHRLAALAARTQDSTTGPDLAQREST